MSECRVPGKVSCENVPRRCKLLADEPKPEQPSPHRVFRILNLLRFRTRGFHHLRHLAEGEAKLYVALKLSCVEPVLLAVRRRVKLEKPELNRAFGEHCVVIEHVVSAVVVVVGSAKVRAVSAVPDVRKLLHGLWFLLVELHEEAGVDRPAVAVHAVLVELQRACKKAFVASHDVREVAQRLRCVVA